MGFKTLLTIGRYSDLLVIDNSVIMRWFFNDVSERDRGYSEFVLSYMKENKIKPVVPSLWVSEASFVSSAYVKNKRFSRDVVQEKLRNAFDMLLVVDPRIEPEALFEFANRHSVSDYDANYALLADNLNCSIATLDKKLARAIVNSQGVLLKRPT